MKSSLHFVILKCRLLLDNIGVLVLSISTMMAHCVVMPVNKPEGAVCRAKSSLHFDFQGAGCFWMAGKYSGLK